MGDCLIDDTPKQTYGEIFQKFFPIYLSYGMSYEDFWEREPELARAYKEAHRIKLIRKDEELWLQGEYTRQALLSTVGNMFLKKGHRAIEYPNKPLLSKLNEVVEKEEDKEQEKFDRIKERMMAMARRINERKGGADGNNNRRITDKDRK